MKRRGSLSCWVVLRRHGRSMLVVYPHSLISAASFLSHEAAIGKKHNPVIVVRVVTFVSRLVHGETDETGGAPASVSEYESKLAYKNFVCAKFPHGDLRDALLA